MTEAEKAVYDEEDPEIPADLFSLWAETEFADDEEESAEAAATAENADDESSEISEPTLDDDEMAYLTSANDATASAEQETIADFGDDGAKSAEIVDNETKVETTAEIADDESSQATEPTLDDDEMAYLTSANDAAASAEQETLSESADDMAESAEQEQIAEAPTELNEVVDGDSETVVTAENVDIAGGVLETEATAENADDESSESTEPTLDETEMAYLTSADNAVASAEQEMVSELAENVAEAEATAEIADDETSETTEPTLDESEIAYLTSADVAVASAEQETKLPAAVPSADAVAESAEVADASSDVTDDDLDDLIDVPILPLPVESTEVTDDDLAFIRAPILSPGDPVSMPSIPVQADPTVPPAELSSPSIVEIVQEQEAIESLGNLTAPKVTDPLALFKKLRDLAEELPHNVYYAFKASRMCATLDEIIADFEA